EEEIEHCGSIQWGLREAESSAGISGIQRPRIPGDGSVARTIQRRRHLRINRRTILRLVGNRRDCEGKMRGVRNRGYLVLAAAGALGLGKQDIHTITSTQSVWYWSAVSNGRSPRYHEPAASYFVHH